MLFRSTLQNWCISSGHFPAFQSFQVLRLRCFCICVSVLPPMLYRFCCVYALQSCLPGICSVLLLPIARFTCINADVCTRIMTTLSANEERALVRHLGGHDLREEPVLQELLERLLQRQRSLQGTQCMTPSPTPHPTPLVSLQTLQGLPPSLREVCQLLQFLLSSR